MTQILDGRVVAQAVRDRLKKEIEQESLHPGLAVILVGDNPASKAYIRMKEKACAEIGIQSFEHFLSASDGPARLIQVLDEVNADDRVHGILLQLPLPDGFDDDDMLARIRPEKDVDGFHPVNLGKLLAGLPTMKSCTPFGVCELLNYYEIPTEGANVVIVGRSNIVGKPLAAMLMQRRDGANATVTVCHSRTKNLSHHTRQADILIAAIGQAEMIKADMVKEGAVVIDVGMNRVDDASVPKGYKLVGDVDFEDVKPKVSAITPVPGGIGPMTISMLMHNTVVACRQASQVVQQV